MLFIDSDNTTFKIKILLVVYGFFFGGGGGRNFIGLSRNCRSTKIPAVENKCFVTSDT